MENGEPCEEITAKSLDSYGRRSHGYRRRTRRMPYGGHIVNVGDVVEMASQGHPEEMNHFEEGHHDTKGEKNAQEELGELNGDQTSIILAPTLPIWILRVISISGTDLVVT
ncbi:hypothetical protein Acr_17g0009200 [Actinidia rufa]|uniref:Uncharacterized protein n=1 Tax=Actinidia rufa TaxID=165716 RepID=A0A7J0G3K7_9ERIC|nr:hypothetical protein Acr_17g0009200 [Actinidia rufa]